MWGVEGGLWYKFQRKSAIHWQWRSLAAQTYVWLPNEKKTKNWKKVFEKKSKKDTREIEKIGETKWKIEKFAKTNFARGN